MCKKFKLCSEFSENRSGIIYLKLGGRNEEDNYGVIGFVFGILPD